MFIGNFPTIIIVFYMIINALWLSHLATPRNRTCIWCLKGRCSCSFSRQDLLGGADPHAIVSLPNQQVIQTMSCGYNSGLTGGTSTCPDRSRFDPRSEIPEKPVEKIKSQKKLNFVFWSPKSKNKLIVIVNGGHEKQNWIISLKIGSLIVIGVISCNFVVSELISLYISLYITHYIYIKK